MFYHDVRCHHWGSRVEGTLDSVLFSQLIIISKWKVKNAQYLVGWQAGPSADGSRVPSLAHSGRDWTWTQLVTGPAAYKKSNHRASWNLSLKFLFLSCQASHLFSVKRSSTAHPRWCVHLGLCPRGLSTGSPENGTLFLLTFLTVSSTWARWGMLVCAEVPLANRPEGGKEGVMWKMGHTEEPLPRLSTMGVGVPNVCASEMQWVWVIVGEIRELMGNQRSRVCKSRVPLYTLAFIMSEMGNHRRVLDNVVTRPRLYFYRIPLLAVLR